MNIFEWQKPLWHQLLDDTESIPHAMIMAGPEGLGKLAFAQAFAARLLCEQQGKPSLPDDMPCGHCNSCSWLASGNHPDFRLIQPEEEEAQEEGDETSRPSVSLRKLGQGPIRVQQIRELNDFVFIGSHCRGRRIAILSPAESMNPAAANALLKVLEEPPTGVYFILVTNALNRLLPTILSRCRKIIFGRPEPELARHWLASEGVKSGSDLLQLLGGAPLLAAHWAEQGKLDTYRKAIEALTENPQDPVAMAAKWSALLKSEQRFGLAHLVDALQKWIFDLLLFKTVGELRYHVAWRKQFEVLLSKVSAVGILSCYQDLLRIRTVVGHPLNPQLFLEDLATRYLRLLASGKS